ncbi:hypothetical protein ZWY2020_001330 [Hordeum vulgare]|nr:hypothetical protein ZWY2020_001330 [Hordeum vulgare]
MAAQWLACAKVPYWTQNASNRRSPASQLIQSGRRVVSRPFSSWAGPSGLQPLLRVRGLFGSSVVALVPFLPPPFLPRLPPPIGAARRPPRRLRIAGKRSRDAGNARSSAAPRPGLQDEAVRALEARPLTPRPLMRRRARRRRALHAASLLHLPAARWTWYTAYASPSPSPPSHRLLLFYVSSVRGSCLLSNCVSIQKAPMISSA